MSRRTRPSIGNVPPASDKFAPEPEDFGQVHKVFTQNLEWLQTDIRGLKKHTWRVPAAFGLASLSFSLAVAGGLEIINHDGKATDAPLMDWILLCAGAVVCLACVVVGSLALKDRNEEVDKVAGRARDLKY